MVVPTLLDQEAHDGEEVAENADAALGCGTLLSQRDDVAWPFAYGAEQIEIDARAESRGPLIGQQRIENLRGRRRV
jgi:hypothetical protein